MATTLSTRNGYKWLDKAMQDTSSKFEVCYSLAMCVMLVNDVAIYNSYLEQPEKHFPPPLDGFVKEGVVGTHLIISVHPQLVLVVIYYYDRFLDMLPTAIHNLHVENRKALSNSRM